MGVQQMIWDDSGKKRGYGYVEFDNEDAVDKIVLVRTHILNGRELEAKKCLTKQQMKEMADNGRGRTGEARGTKRLREAVDPEDKIMRKLTSPTRRVLEEIENRIEPVKKRLETDLLLSDSDEEEKENSEV